MFGDSAQFRGPEWEAAGSRDGIELMLLTCVLGQLITLLFVHLWLDPFSLLALVDKRDSEASQKEQKKKSINQSSDHIS